MKILKRVADWLYGRKDAAPRQRVFDDGKLTLLSTDEELAMTVEERWMRNNERNRQRGCPCGKPAEVAHPHQVMGAVPYIWWTCREHAGAEMFSGGEPGYSHPTACPLGENLGSGGPIGQAPDHFYCSHREH